MIFSHFSIWGIALILAFFFVLKYYAIAWILKTSYAEARTQGQTWVASLMTNACLNAVIDFVILFFFAGLLWAIVISLIDGAFHYLTGYWKKRGHLPAIDLKNEMNVAAVISFLHTNSYLGLAAIVVGYLFPHSPLAATLQGLAK